jgi:hypothetical protein
MLKKILKWLVILLVLGVGVILITLVNISEDLPDGIEGKEADDLAVKVLNVLNYEAFKKTKMLTWSFPGGHEYVWHKNEGEVRVTWNSNEVLLDLSQNKNSKVLKPEGFLNPEDKAALIKTATNYFNNDSFWLIAPYKLFDEGVARKIVKLDKDEKALLVTYKEGGSTPGDSYLWILDENGRPKSFKMWVQIIPVGGLEASWEGWEETNSGAIIANKHNILFFDLVINDLKTYN